MRLALFCLSCCLLGMTVACKRGQVLTPPLAPVLPTDRLLYLDDQAGYPYSDEFVVNDPATWAAVWRTANANQASAPPLPPVAQQGRHGASRAGVTDDEQVGIFPVTVFERHPEGLDGEAASGQRIPQALR